MVCGEPSIENKKGPQNEEKGGVRCLVLNPSKTGKEEES